MKYTLICDESGTNERFLIVGALTLRREDHPLLADELQQLKRKLGFCPEGEIKWGKVSAKYLDRYQKIMTLFFKHLRANRFGSALT